MSFPRFTAAQLAHFVVAGLAATASLCAAACSPAHLAPAYRLGSVTVNGEERLPRAPFISPQLEVTSSICARNLMSVRPVPPPPPVPTLRLRCWQQGVAIIDEPFTELGNAQQPSMSAVNTPLADKAVLIGGGHAMCLVSAGRTAAPAISPIAITQP